MQRPDRYHHQGDDEELDNDFSQLSLSDQTPSQVEEDPIPYPPDGIPEGWRYSPPPKPIPVLSPSPVFQQEQTPYPTSYTIYPQIPTDGPEGVHFDRVQAAQQRAIQLQQHSRSEISTGNPSANIPPTFPMFYGDGRFRGGPYPQQDFHQQLPHDLHRVMEGGFGVRNNWVGQMGQGIPDDNRSVSDYVSTAWDPLSERDDFTEPGRSREKERLVETTREMENPFISSRVKARSDTEYQPGSIRQPYRQENNHPLDARKLRPGTVKAAASPPERIISPEPGFKPSLLPRKLDFSGLGAATKKDKKQEDDVKTPAQATKSEEEPGKYWGFGDRPLTSPEAATAKMMIPEIDASADAKSTSGIETIVKKEHPLVDIKAVEAKKAEHIKRIQEQFKAQVARRFEESQRVIIPVSVANEAYTRLDKLGLLTHPALRLGLLHNKADSRGVHQKFLELIQSLTIEEYNQMAAHHQMSDHLLRDLGMTIFSLYSSRGKIPAPVQTPFQMLGIPMPDLHETVHTGSTSSNEENKEPSRRSDGGYREVGVPGRLSSDPRIRKIQFETGDYDQNLIREFEPVFRDPTFRAAPAHWSPPEGFEKDFPSAARWEEIAIIKTYHQALIVQQHLYLMFVNLGTPFTMDWLTFTMAKEREAMIVKAFNRTARMTSDDGHRWVDKEWSTLSEDVKEERLKMGPPLNPSRRPKFLLSEYREVDGDGFPVQFSRDMYKGITIHITNPPPIEKFPPKKPLGTYGIFCHELESYCLARDPRLMSRLISHCLIAPKLEDFPVRPEDANVNPFYRPAMSIKDPLKVRLSTQLEDALPFMAGIPLGPNILERVKADRTLFYSTFCYNLVAIWRDYRDEKIWWYGNGTPYRYDTNNPPAMLGHPKSKFPKDEKWTDGSEIEKHTRELQNLIDILNLGICLERWTPGDDQHEDMSDEVGNIFQRTRKKWEDEAPHRKQ
ncbi:hypothetical protein ABW19_dt0203765 [Dactylella cylindrospora]|nr:hypothetical protein ABW19_dt0203765 [Dactylella cylindrospora]